MKDFMDNDKALGMLCIVAVVLIATVAEAYGATSGIARDGILAIASFITGAAVAKAGGNGG